MAQVKRRVIAFLLGAVMTLALVFGVALSLPTAFAKAETLSTENWTCAREGTDSIRIQNGTA